MTNFKKLAASRYSTKQYDPTKKISAEKIQELKQILRMSPSSLNTQPWKFTFIANEALKNKLSKVSFHNESKIQEASHLVVFSAIDDLSILHNQINRCLPEEKIALFNSFIETMTVETTKTWLSKQLYISLGFFLSACASLGIDSTPMEGIEPDAYKELLSLKGYQPLFAVCIGYRDKNDFNQPSKLPKSRLPLTDIIEDIL